MNLCGPRFEQEQGPQSSSASYHLVCSLRASCGASTALAGHSGRRAWAGSQKTQRPSNEGAQIQALSGLPFTRFLSYPALQKNISRIVVCGSAVSKNTRTHTRTTLAP